MMSDLLCIDIQRHDSSWGSFLDQDICHVLNDVAGFCLKKKMMHFHEDQQVELSLILTHDDHIQELNCFYRGIDRATNILSFPQYERQEWQEFKDLTDYPLIMGDMIMAYETFVRESEEMKRPLKDHVSHLLIHGFLHLLGYDHQDDLQAQEMEALESIILMQQGVPDPYKNSVPLG